MAKKPETIVCADGWEVLAQEMNYPGSWGRADSIKAAIDRAVKAGASRKSNFVIYLVPPGTRMDEFGFNLQWDLDKCSFKGQQTIKVGSTK